jgi:Mrp family chromosome partitioning ATPase
MFRYASKSFSATVQKAWERSTVIKGVDFVVAVSSAKGGVGKSTVAGAIVTFASNLRKFTVCMLPF